MEQLAHQGPELTTAQARAVYAIRRNHPDAELTFHERTWGFILELTRTRPSGGRKVLALARFATDGSIRPDMPLPLAPRPVR
jgi:ribosomal protein L34